MTTNGYQGYHDYHIFWKQIGHRYFAQFWPNIMGKKLIPLGTCEGDFLGMTGTHPGGPDIQAANLTIIFPPNVDHLSGNKSLAADSYPILATNCDSNCTQSSSFGVFATSSAGGPPIPGVPEFLGHNLGQSTTT